MRTRLISSAVGLCVLFAVILLRNTLVLPVILGIVIAIILYELAKAVGGRQHKLALCTVLSYGFLSPISQYLLMQGTNEMIMQIGSMVKYLLLPVCLMLLFMDFVWHHEKFTVEQLGFMGGSMYAVSWSLTMLITLCFGEDFCKHGLFHLIMALGGAWIADSGAYFCGVAMGKRKLCPKISPKKTIEGFIGGIVCNAVVFVLIFMGNIWFTNRLEPHPLAAFTPMIACKAAALGAVLAVISVIGDLSASVIKRQKGIKDYGNIMPGHGGLMDRFDSVLFVVPAYSVFLTLFPII